MGAFRQVFENSDNLEKFLILRLRYLLQMLSGTFHNLPAVARCIDGSDHVATLVRDLLKLETTGAEMLTLQTCDLLLSSSDWTTTWACALLKSRTVQEILDFFEKDMGISLQVPDPKTRIRRPTGGNKNGADEKLEGIAGEGVPGKVDKEDAASGVGSAGGQDAVEPGAAPTSSGEAGEEVTVPDIPVLKIQAGVSLGTINMYKDRWCWTRYLNKQTNSRQ